MSENDIKTYTLDEIRQMKSLTDWDKLRARSDYQGEQEFPVDWTRAELVTPEPKSNLATR